MADRPLVVYHDQCPDGFCCAWLMYRAFKGQVDFHPARRSEDLPDFTGRIVYALDFTPRYGDLVRLFKQAKQVILLDHHATAESTLKQLKEGMPEGWFANNTIVLDKTHSAAWLTWAFLTDDIVNDKPPWLVSYVEDHDLWRHKLADSKAISAALSSYPFDFIGWDAILEFKDDPLAWNEFVAAGYTIINYQRTLVDKICANAFEEEIDGYEILTVNTPILVNEAAEKLAEGRPFGLAFYCNKDRKIIASMRVRDGDVDVSKIAEAHGGGGHPRAAGFVMEE